MADRRSDMVMKNISLFAGVRNLFHEIKEIRIIDDEIMDTIEESFIVVERSVLLSLIDGDSYAVGRSIPSNI